MRFAINYSPAAAALVDSGAIDVDVFKCPAPSDPVVAQYLPTLIEDARRVRPIYVHFPVNTSRVGISGPAWGEIDAVLAETETPFVNVHLYATADEFGEIPVESIVKAHVDAVGEALVRSVSIVVDRYGADRVIVENCVHGARVLRACIEPAVIERVVRETGCGLLLDLAHARLTCADTGIDVREYITALPVDRLRELHVTGTGDGEQLRDSMPMNADDWALYEWACGRIRGGQWSTPWAVAFEYGGIGPIFDWRSDPVVIAEQAPRLRSMSIA